MEMVKIIRVVADCEQGMAYNEKILFMYLIKANIEEIKVLHTYVK